MDNSGNFVATESEFCYNDVSNINRFIANKNPFRYRSYYYDFETGLYYLNSRYYDPETGRFINIDDISVLSETQDVLNGINLYAYCLNNPINDTDTEGNLSLWQILLGITSILAAIAISVLTFGTATPVIAGMAIGATLFAGVEIGKQLITSGSITDWSAIGLAFFGGAISGAIAAIPINGFGVLSYVGTFVTGAAGAVLSGVVTNQITDTTSGLTAALSGGAFNVFAKFLTHIFSLVKAKQIYNLSNKAKSLKIQQLQGSKFNIGVKALKGSYRNAFKNTGLTEILKILTNHYGFLRNGIYSSLISTVIGLDWR